VGVRELERELDRACAIRDTLCKRLGTADELLAAARGERDAAAVERFQKEVDSLFLRVRGVKREIEALEAELRRAQS
jgi:hypothetical protein